MSVTVARYQTPSGTNINKVGIKPVGPWPSGSEDMSESSAELPKTPEAFVPLFLHPQSSMKDCFHDGI